MSLFLHGNNKQKNYTFPINQMISILLDLKKSNRVNVLFALYFLSEAQLEHWVTYSRSRLALTEDDNDGNCGDLLRLTALSLSQYFLISLKLWNPVWNLVNNGKIEIEALQCSYKKFMEWFTHANFDDDPFSRTSCHQGYKDFGIHHVIIMMFPDCNTNVVNRHNCVYILFLKRLCGGNRCKWAPLFVHKQRKWFQDVQLCHR